MHLDRNLWGVRVARADRLSPTGIHWDKSWTMASAALLAAGAVGPALVAQRASDLPAYVVLLMTCCLLVSVGGWALGDQLARWQASRAGAATPSLSGSGAMPGDSFRRARHSDPLRSGHLAALDRPRARAFHAAVLLEGEGDVAGAAEAYRRAAERGSIPAQTCLGVLLHTSGDRSSARRWYRSALENGDPIAAFNLGLLCEEEHDAVGAELAYRCADKRGHAAGAANLGVLLEARGERRRAQAAYGRAHRRGDFKGALNLALLLEEHGDVLGAHAAHPRPEEILRARLQEASLSVPATVTGRAQIANGRKLRKRSA